MGPRIELLKFIRKHGEIQYVSVLVKVILYLSDILITQLANLSHNVLTSRSWFD